MNLISHEEILLNDEKKNNLHEQREKKSAPFNLHNENLD